MLQGEGVGVTRFLQSWSFGAVLHGLAQWVSAGPVGGEVGRHGVVPCLCPEHFMPETLGRSSCWVLKRLKLPETRNPRP